MRKNMRLKLIAHLRRGKKISSNGTGLSAYCTSELESRWDFKSWVENSCELVSILSEWKTLSSVKGPITRAGNRNFVAYYRQSFAAPPFQKTKYLSEWRKLKEIKKQTKQKKQPQLDRFCILFWSKTLRIACRRSFGNYHLSSSVTMLLYHCLKRLICLYFMVHVARIVTQD